MEEEKMVKNENEIANANDSNNKNSIIAVLVVIIIALIGTVVYFAFINKADKLADNSGGNNQTINDNTNGSNGLQEDDSSNYDAWMNYLLNQNIKSIIFQEGFGYDSPSGPIKLSVEKLKSYFSEFKSHNFKLYKEYWGGRGDASNVLSITYTKNGKEYTIDLEGGGQVIGKPEDKELLEKLESIGYTERKLDGYDADNALIVYVFYDANCDIENDDECFSIDYTNYLK